MGFSTIHLILMRGNWNSIGWQMLVAVTILIATLFGCSSKSCNEQFQSWMFLPLPGSATVLEFEAPSGLSRFKSNSFYAKFKLDSEAIVHLIASPPNGYTPWMPLVEVYSNKRFFTRSQYPAAFQTSRITAHEKSYLIADPEAGLVHAIAWRD